MNIVCPNANCGRFQIAEFDGTGKFRCKNCKTEFAVKTPPITLLTFPRQPIIVSK